jgi:methyltransferase (TIGR00027 family)
VVPTESPIRNISDTARWSAVYRARETLRPDALFRDPFASRLAGERGEQIAKSMTFSDRNTWSWVARTVLYDRFIMSQIEQGADTVINLAAGLDARPYRMALPASLRWVEIDLPEILAFKQEILANEKPACLLERHPLDLADVDARRELFARLGEGSKKATIVAEGFLIYLSAADVGALSADLANIGSFQSWIVDLASPGLLALLQKHLSAQLAPSGSSLKFAPREGPGFFRDFGWTPADVRSLLKTAAQLKRLTLKMRLLAMLPESNGAQGSRPWGGVCLLTKERSAG